MRADLVGAYPWKWRADLAAVFHRLRFPHRQVLMTPVAEREWHPWRLGRRWVERRVLAPWFSAGASDREQFRAGPSEAAASDFDLAHVTGEADELHRPETPAAAAARQPEPVNPA